MTINQTIKILIRANKWRRGAEIEMPDPKEFGEAIDVAIEVMEQFLKDTPAMKRCHTEEDKTAEEKRTADLQKADNWEVTTYGIEGSNKWGRIAVNVKTGVKTTLGGCNFSLIFPEPITEKRPATKEEVEKIKAMFNRFIKGEI